ncbi:iron-sulfur assembly protein IscA-like 2, mitochondrial [Magnolia sinica]|uniref:iron-sulfur assembly protein IscA-like 2, mitochondrial n=1 Tax=Magnolia sinica TaxID=86752 RepID=UPI002657ABBB|nr:iron-sulfur assembly protein IscA-like 2, mitochondrial [Magnolia sinica]
MSSTSRSLLHRLTPFITTRLRQNQRLLSSAVRIEESPIPTVQEDAVHMTENCIRRMKELHSKEASAGGKMLRLSVEAGGCSGFQYAFLLDDKANSDDRIFEKEGVKLVVDTISYDFVKGATVDYVEELIRSAFLVTTNPRAAGGCSCKSSFMVK